MGAVRSKNQRANGVIDRLDGTRQTGKLGALRCALALFPPSPFVATPNYVWSTEGEGLDNLNIVRVQQKDCCVPADSRANTASRIEVTDISPVRRSSPLRA